MSGLIRCLSLLRICNRTIRDSRKSVLCEPLNNAHWYSTIFFFLFQSYCKHTLMCHAWYFTIAWFWNGALSLGTKKLLFQKRPTKARHLHYTGLEFTIQKNASVHNIYARTITQNLYFKIKRDSFRFFCLWYKTFYWIQEPELIWLRLAY